MVLHSGDDPFEKHLISKRSLALFQPVHFQPLANA